MNARKLRLVLPAFLVALTGSGDDRELGDERGRPWEPARTGRVPGARSRLGPPWQTAARERPERQGARGRELRSP